VDKPIIPQRPVSNVRAPTDVLSNNVRPNEKEAAQSKPVATDAIHWTELSYDLGLQGFAQAIAINSVVGHYEKDHLQLFLTPDFMKFVNPENQDEICQALASKLGLSLILDLKTLDRLDAETPSETRMRKEQEDRQTAIESIRQEQTVKKLQQAFGAELVESSVQLVDEL
jgi:DNA polymerase-3 subunit gamma/tau